MTKQQKNQRNLKQKRQTLNSKFDQHELFRLNELNQFEIAARKKGFNIIAGIDEAGRGPLAGPVVAASCIFPKDFFLPGVDDSKKLSPARRHYLYQELINNSEVTYSVGIVDQAVIDEINIYQATIKAMIAAVDGLNRKPDYLLVDGLELPHPSIPGEGIIKGDQRSHLIAAASIIAKETRDLMMIEFHEKWPQYGFDRHKGYGTRAHLEAIHQHGPCPLHRISFEPIKSMLNSSEPSELQFSLF